MTRARSFGHPTGRAVPGHASHRNDAEVAKSLLTSGHALDLVIGVAGSGKTSTLSAVREGFEAAGYHVVGAATSGQAAKALGQGAGVASRTVASLTWRLEHGREALYPSPCLGPGRRGYELRRRRREVTGGRRGLGGQDWSLSVITASSARSAPAAPWRPWLLAILTTCGHSRTTSDKLTRANDTPSTISAPADLPSALDWYVAHGRVHPAPSREEAMYDDGEGVGVRRGRRP